MTKLQLFTYRPHPVIAPLSATPTIAYKKMPDGGFVFDIETSRIVSPKSFGSLNELFA